MKIRTLIIGVAATFAAVQALAADAPPPILVRGQIVSIDAKSVTIVKEDGTSITGSLLPTTAFAAVEPRRIDQIVTTDFVGITSVPGPGDTMIAEEIHLIPLKGLGEGSYPWDHHPGGGTKAGSMTNGTVTMAGPAKVGSMTNGTVTTSGSAKLKVAYRGSALVNGKCVGHAVLGGPTPCTGVADVTVTPTTAIVAIVRARPADAKPGLTVFANMANGADGKPVVGSIVLEKNGVKPPM
jgi:hypothetical protein